MLAPRKGIERLASLICPWPEQSGCCPRQGKGRNVCGVKYLRILIRDRWVGAENSRRSKCVRESLHVQLTTRQEQAIAHEVNESRGLQDIPARLCYACAERAASSCIAHGAFMDTTV